VRILTGKITIIKQVPNGDALDFNFTSNVTGYENFILDDDEDVFDAPNPSQYNDTISMTTETGIYNVTEDISTEMQQFWRLTAINCSVNGTSGSSTQDLGNTSVKIDLKQDDEVTCVFVNETDLPTLTQGFYRTHTDITNATFNDPLPSASAIGFSSGVIIIGSSTTGLKVDNIKEVFGLYYSSNHFNEGSTLLKSDNTVRTPEEQSFIIMAHQLLTAKLNCGVFGCTASAISMIQHCDEAFANGDSSEYGACTAWLDDYNNHGDSGAFDFEAAFGIGPGATPKKSKDLAESIITQFAPDFDSLHYGDTGISRWDSPTPSTPPS